MNVAKEIARRSHDRRLKVGCIIVSEDNTTMLSVGYNGNAAGLDNEPESDEPGKSQLIHAENNALIKAPFHFPLKKHLYVTHSPCKDCSKLIINARISRIVYGDLYRDTSGLDLIKRSGIEVLSMEQARLLTR
jgi:dCMP deaminase